MPRFYYDEEDLNERRARKEKELRRVQDRHKRLQQQEAAIHPEPEPRARDEDDN